MTKRVHRLKYPRGKASAQQWRIVRYCQGFAVIQLQLHPRRLGSEALRLLQRWGKQGQSPASYHGLWCWKCLPSLQRVCFFGNAFDLMEQIIFYDLYPLRRVGDFKSSGIFIATLIYKVNFYDGLVQVNAF